MATLNVTAPVAIDMRFSPPVLSSFELVSATPTQITFELNGYRLVAYGSFTLNDDMTEVRSGTVTRYEEWDVDVRVLSLTGFSLPASVAEHYYEANDPAGLAARVLNGNDSIHAHLFGVANDYLNGYNGNDTIYGYSGHDVLNGGNGNDTLYGGRGHDRLSGMNGRDTLNGGDDNDWLDGGNGGDTLNGGDGHDVLSGGNGSDRLRGNDGNDTLNGGHGPDVLDGGSGRDTASYASATAAVVVNLSSATPQNIGSAGPDTLVSIENLTGGAGNDTLTGNSVANTLSGGGGNDTLVGGGGNDLLLGGNGNDILRGQAGADTLAGGPGADRFDFDLVTDSGLTAATRDVVTDFVRAQGDRIDLSGIDANAAAAGNQAFTFIGAAAFSAPGQLRYDAVNDLVLGSIDADATAEFAIKVNGMVNMIAADFVL